jgi:hypothetical protein
MAQSGYTPISIYYSATATNVPTAGNLVAGELAINTADGKLYYKNSSNAVTLLADATSASGTLINPTITDYTESVVAIGTVGASSTLSLTNGTIQTATLTTLTPCTFTMPTATSGKSFVLRITQAATVGTTATFTGVKWPAGLAPVVTVTASAVDIFSFICIGGTWYGTVAQAFA